MNELKSTHVRNIKKLRYSISPCILFVTAFKCISQSRITLIIQSADKIKICSREYLLMILNVLYHSCIIINRLAKNRQTAAKYSLLTKVVDFETKIS